MVADRINREEKNSGFLGLEGKEENKKKTKRIHQKGSPALDTLFVHGMPWHAYAVAVKANRKGHRSLSYNSIMSTRVGYRYERRFFSDGLALAPVPTVVPLAPECRLPGGPPIKEGGVSSGRVGGVAVGPRGSIRACATGGE